MGRKGRPRKVIIAINAKWGLGIDAMNYTVERYFPSTDSYRPESWYGTLADCVEGFLERGVKSKALDMFGEGVSKLTVGAVEKILEEVSEDERRLFARLHERRDDWDI